MGSAHLQESCHSAGATLVDTAYATLENLLVTGALPPLSLFTEVELSHRVGIGRTPVREALQRLEREGLVRAIPYRGIQVTGEHVAAQLEWLEVRLPMEKLIAVSAARRASAAERQRMLQLARHIVESADAGDGATFMRLDRELHGQLIQSTRNSALADIMQLKQGINRRFWYLHARLLVDLPRCARLHADLLRAVANGDESAAEQAAGLLVDDCRDTCRQVAANGIPTDGKSPAKNRRTVVRKRV